MPIHEKSLIRPENLVTHEHLELEGVDVSGHWSTFINSRAVTDYNEQMEEEIAALPGGEFIHRCWQCGSCTNSCTVNAINPDFNPRYWIYLIRVGMEAELLRDKDIIWQCVSCNKCTYACPRDVNPEGVMKATAHWLELKGHTRPKPATVFDDVFSSQVFETGKIEDGLVLRHFFARQELGGGVYWWNRFRDKKEPYRPVILTQPGSVFVLDLVEGKRDEAAGVLTGWRDHGLPQLAAAPGGADWRANPWLAENGYGEVAINPTLHQERMPPTQGESKPDQGGRS